MATSADSVTKTEADILDAAVELLDAPRSRAVTVNEIADRAGYSLNTVYRRFPGKDAILRAAAQLHLRRTWTVQSQLLATPAPQSLADVESMVRLVIETWVRSMLQRRRGKRVLLLHFMAQEELVIELVRASLALATANFATILERSAALVEPITDDQVRMLAQAVVGNARTALMIDPQIAEATAPLVDDLTLLVMRFLTPRR
jgi:AcrR family transcriptional regulator